MDNKIHVFSTAPKILFGFGAAQETGKEIKRFGCTRPLLVTDKVLREAGIIEGVFKALLAEGVVWEIYEGVGVEPTVEHVEGGLAIYRDKKCDGLISVGGGSCMDAGKAIAIMATNPGSIRDYQGWDKYGQPKAPMIAIPTTAGTGSEVTQSTLITDLQRKVKMRILSPKNMPEVAIEDPTLTVSMPQGITAGTGIDALTHAIEGFISIRSQPITDALAMPAIEKIAGSLPAAWANGHDLQARGDMMLGQLLAAMTFTNASTALVHGMARTAGAFFHISHGMSNAILLPYVMEYTMPAVPEKFAQIAKAMGENITGLTLTESAEKAVGAVKRLCKGLKIPSLRQVGVSEEALPEMARDVLYPEGGTPSFNPRKATVQDVQEIFRRALDSQ